MYIQVKRKTLLTEALFQVHNSIGGRIHERQYD